jgi:hypothetical protein
VGQDFGNIEVIWPSGKQKIPENRNIFDKQDWTGKSA